MAKKIILKDRQGNQLLPITKGDFVETATGKTLLTTLSEIQHELDGKQEALTAGSYITIDGSYVIDVNVTHEYSAQSYLPISSYGVAAHIDEIEEATAAALTTLHHENSVISGYVNDIKATYATKSYVEDYAENEILPLIPIVDNRILSSSENPVQNKAVYEALEDVRVTVDTALDASSYNPVANKAVTYVITENEQIVSEALHGLDTRVTLLEENGGGGIGSGETSLCYYDASWLCGYTMNENVSDDLIDELISYNDNGTPILIDGHSCDVTYSVVQGGLNGNEINASSHRLWISYTRTLSNTYTADYLGYGIGDGSLALNTTYLVKTVSALVPGHFKLEYSIDTEINPSSLIVEMYGEFTVTDGVLYAYNNRIAALETAYTYFSDIDDELSETSYKAVTNARITQEFNTLSDVTATALTDHENRVAVLETAYTAMNDLPFTGDAAYLTNLDTEFSLTSTKPLTNSYLTTSYNIHESRIRDLERTVLGGTLSYYDASWMDGADVDNMSVTGLANTTWANAAFEAAQNGDYFYINGNICDVTYVNNTLYMSYIYHTNTIPNIREITLSKSRTLTLSRKSKGVTMFSTRQSVTINTVGDPTDYSGTISYCTGDGNYYFVNSNYSLSNGRYKKILTQSDVTDTITNGSTKVVTSGAVYTTVGDLVSYNYLSQQSYLQASSLNDYATKTYVTDRIAEIPTPDMSAYVSKEYLSQQSYLQASALNDYVTNTNLATTLSSYAKTTDLADNETVITAFLTQWQSYVDDLRSRVAELETAVAALQNA